MATCPEGHQNSDDAAFCVTCGKPLAGAAGSDGPTPLVSDPAAAVPPPPVAVPQPAGSTPPAATPSYAPPGSTPPAATPSYAPPAGQPVAGRPVAPPPAYAPAGQPADGGVAPPYRFQLRRLTPVDQITAGAAIVLFIALWMPWFGLSGAGYDYSIHGINAHSYLAFVVLTTVLLVSYLAARAGWDRLPVRLPVAHAPLLLVLGLVQLLLVVVAFFSTPAHLDHKAGSVIALIAALAAVLPIVIPVVRASQRR
ncbi:MAG: zinc ribbon domain-containing protein [Actinobacteria bacterium]|nr:zinc ribbon domain-containing protein [Actinomycetota bacterium]